MPLDNALTVRAYKNHRLALIAPPNPAALSCSIPQGDSCEASVMFPFCRQRGKHCRRRIFEIGVHWRGAEACGQAVG